jgi:hypothetical protein
MFRKAPASGWRNRSSAVSIIITIKDPITKGHYVLLHYCHLTWLTYSFYFSSLNEQNGFKSALKQL